VCHRWQSVAVECDVFSFSRGLNLQGFGSNVELIKMVIVNLRVIVVLDFDRMSDPSGHNVGRVPSVQPISFAGSPQVLN